MYFCGVIILLWIALLEKLANPLERQVFIYFNQHLNSTKDVTFIEIKRMLWDVSNPFQIRRDSFQK